MKITILTMCAMLTLSLAANAAEYKQVYLIDGKAVPSEQAIMAALKGTEVLKCTTVEAKVSKSGTSIGLRNIKKPKKD